MDVSLNQCGCALSGLPGGACAPARVPAEEHRNGEQEAEGPAGGATEPQPAGEEGAGGRRPGASGATVSDVDRSHFPLIQLKVFSVSQPWM